MCAQVKDFQHCIFNFHVPPIDSTLDSCPKLDWDTDPPSPIMSGGQIVFAGAGSRAVRNAIEKHQPMLGLHGHIHEAQGVIKIGRTTCIILQRIRRRDPAGLPGKHHWRSSRRLSDDQWIELNSFDGVIGLKMVLRTYP